MCLMLFQYRVQVRYYSKVQVLTMLKEKHVQTTSVTEPSNRCYGLQVSIHLYRCTDTHMKRGGWFGKSAFNSHTNVTQDYQVQHLDKYSKHMVGSKISGI